MATELSQEELDICEGYFEVTFNREGGIFSESDLQTLLMQ